MLFERTLPLLLLVVGTGAASCYRVPAGDIDGGDLLDRLRSEGTVRLGIAGEIPFGYIDRDGEFTGEAPEIAKVLIDTRNANWVRWLEHRLDQPGTVLVAVGAGHLAGKGSVIELLQKQGYKVERMQ